MRHDELRILRAHTEGTAEATVQRRRRRTDAYPSAWRSAIDKVARLSPALEDLADSFPALLFALATGYGTATERSGALAAVIDGLPLREAAARLGLPFWLRKLPAGALNAPIVAPPSEPQLVNRLMSLIPATPAAAAAWLDRVLIAHHTGRPDLALWVAQQYRGLHPSPRSTQFLALLAWAWFAGPRAGNATDHNTGHRAGQLLTERWKPGIGARRAAGEARLWRERIALDICLGPGLADTWIADGEVGGISFVALRTADDFIAEAKAMDNCLDRYADRLQGRSARVFSVRRDGRSVADIEIAAHEREPGHPVIAQLRGPHNRRAPLELWQAAYAWLGGQPLRLADKSLEVRSGRTVRERRQAGIWQPYLDVLPPHACEIFTTAIYGKSGRAKPRRSARKPSARPAS